MRQKYGWGNLSYSLLFKNGDIKDYPKENCFTKLRNSPFTIDLITIYNIQCKPSKDYTMLYLNYISEMLKLKKVDISDDHITFKAYKCNIKNMLVGSLVRFLFERIGDQTFDQVELFFKPLLIDGICEYKDKFERFCYFYKCLANNNYFRTGHAWKPIDTKIKTLQDLRNYKFESYNKGVNSFFTT